MSEWGSFYGNLVGSRLYHVFNHSLRPASGWRSCLATQSIWRKCLERIVHTSNIWDMSSFYFLGLLWMGGIPVGNASNDPNSSLHLVIRARTVDPGKRVTSVGTDRACSGWSGSPPSEGHCSGLERVAASPSRLGRSH